MLIDLKTVEKYIEKKISFSIGRHGISFDCVWSNDTWYIKCQRARMSIFVVELRLSGDILKGEEERGVNGLSIDLSDYELLCRIHDVGEGKQIKEKVR